MEKELLGIDEAGRGPVIGPMVIAGCVTNAAIDEKLQALGVKDSKMIAPKKRDLLFEVVKKSVLSYEIIVVSPQDVDAALNNPDLNLNKLEALTSAKIINAIVEKYDGNFEVMIDSPTNTPKPYVKFVEKLVTKNIAIHAEIKADQNHIAVSAASILAKVTRDRLIESLEKEVIKKFGFVEIGSGYPSDPKTKAFLASYWNKLDYIEGGFFRKSWASYKNVVSAQKQKSLF